MTRPWKLCHTADWHLGHTLHGRPRDEEHGAFLAWLLDLLEAERVDALVVAGDVFDTANPSGAAQAMFYGFLAALRRRCPSLQGIVVAGNHDSAARLGAPDPLLRGLGVRLIGASPSAASLDGPGALDPVIVPIVVGDATVGQVVALPYLRNADLPPLEPLEDEAPGARFVRAVRLVYEATAARARTRLGEGALVVTGHCHAVGAALSEKSERPVVGGIAGALPADVFPADAAYVALGHLHLAQAVGGRAHVRYSGSPIPLAFDEERYVHQVQLVEFEGARMRAHHTRPVPRSVGLLRIPREGAAPLEEVLEALRVLPLEPGLPEARWPWLEVRVRMTQPDPALRAKVDAVLADRPVRLVRIASERDGTGEGLQSAPVGSLADLHVRDVFLRRWATDHPGAPPDALMSAFDEAFAQASAAEDA